MGSPGELFNEMYVNIKRMMMTIVFFFIYIDVLQFVNIFLGGEGERGARFVPTFPTTEPTAAAATFPAKEFKSMLPKIREFTSSSPIPSARVSTLTGTSSSPLNCTSCDDARVIVIAITNVKSFILISICYSFKKFIQIMF